MHGVGDNAKPFQVLECCYETSHCMCFPTTLEFTVVGDHMSDDNSKYEICHRM